MIFYTTFRSNQFFPPGSPLSPGQSWSGSQRDCLMASSLAFYLPSFLPILLQHLTYWLCCSACLFCQQGLSSPVQAEVPHFPCLVWNQISSGLDWPDRCRPSCPRHTFKWVFAVQGAGRHCLAKLRSYWSHRLPAHWGALLLVKTCHCQPTGLAICKHSLSLSRLLSCPLLSLASPVVSLKKDLRPYTGTSAPSTPHS